MKISEQTVQQPSRKRFSARSIMLLALIVVGGSGVAYGLAYGLNATTANAHNLSDSFGNWGPYPGRFGLRYNSTSSFRTVSTVDSVSVMGFSIASNNQVSLTLSYSGSATPPALTIVAIAPGLSGGNTVSAGWSSPTTTTVSLAGTGSLSSNYHIGILVVPYTGA